MIVKNQIDAMDISEHVVQGKYQNGAKRLIISNGHGYHNVILEFQEFDGEWVVKGTMELSGSDIQKAVTNAMND